MEDTYFINGEYKEVDDPQITPDNIGLLRGYGIFEFMRTYNGKLFRFDEHMDRLFSSARMMNMEIPYGRNRIREITEKLKERNGMDNYSIRVVITGGRVISHTGYNPKTPTFMVLCEPPKSLPEKYYGRGVELLTLRHQRILPEAKYTNYILPISKKEELEEKDKFDFLYVDNGKVLESVTSNFFLIKEKKLITPEEGVLKGITRDLVIELAENHFEIIKRDIEVSELSEADEAFLTATIKEVLPVVKIDETVIGDGGVRKETKKIMSLFKRYVDNY